MKRISFMVLLLIFCITTMPTLANEQVIYTSQADEIAIFLNNIAFARDYISVAGGTDAQIVLPPEIFPDTLIVRENGDRAATYRINYKDNQVLLILSTSEADREITLEYLMQGISWQPSYDMWLQDENNVHLDFFVEIKTPTLSLNNVEMTLVAGRVDTSQQVNAISTVTTNQYIAGYVETENPVSTGPVSIQHLYQLGTISAEAGDTIYTSVLQHDFPARRLILWNAQLDRQATVIYKVSNNSDMPLAEGIVRSYQDSLFVGSDFIEQTPIGSEGSVTVGGLQDVRVNRAETRSRIAGRNDDYDTYYEVTLTLSNFSDSYVDVEVVDAWNPSAQNFQFSQEPQRSPDNLFRWQVAIPAGETITIDYEYRVD